MSSPKRVECPAEKAEGLIYYPGVEYPIPYNTWSAGPEGCHLHIWLDTPYHGAQTARKVKSFVTHFRDVVSSSYSGGKPTGYWANQHIIPQRK